MLEDAESKPVNQVTEQRGRRTPDAPATTGLRPPWPKGFAPNPSGRPAGQVALIKALTCRGEDMIKFWVATMNDDKARLRDRLAASVELANRLWGKPRETLEVVGDGQQLRIRLSWQDASAPGEVLDGAVRVLPPTTMEGPALPADDQPAEVAD